MARGFVVAVLGTTCTGKTSLACQLRDALVTEGWTVALVEEHAGESGGASFHEPAPHQQASIAQGQTRHIDEAALSHDVVIADTTALVTAVHSDLVLGDKSLYAQAEQAHTRYALTLLTALDLPLQIHGSQKDGLASREEMDTRLRNALQRMGHPYAVITGSEAQQLERALLAVRHALSAPSPREETGNGSRWQWVCERCDDADCERHLLPRTTAGS
jgi:nicotinamide riboside kinase